LLLLAASLASRLLLATSLPSKLLLVIGEATRILVLAAGLLLEEGKENFT
jgi:hypothetical protein